MKKTVIAMCGLMALLASPAKADLITNGSFENGTFTGGSFGFPLAQQVIGPSAILPGWNVTGELAWFETGQSGISAEDGNFALDLTGFCDTHCGGSTYGGVNQDIATTIGATYTLQFFEGNYATQGIATGITAIAGATSQDFSVPATNLPSTWGFFSMDFTATSTTTNIAFAGTAGANYIGLDNISVVCSSETNVACASTVATPEPSTIAFFGAALLSVFGWGRLRRRADA